MAEEKKYESNDEESTNPSQSPFSKGRGLEEKKRDCRVAALLAMTGFRACGLGEMVKSGNIEKGKCNQRLAWMKQR